jgi:hypothetical protein
MKNITKSVQVLSRVIDLLLGSNFTTESEQSLYYIKTKYQL